MVRYIRDVILRAQQHSENHFDHDNTWSCLNGKSVRCLWIDIQGKCSVDGIGFYATYMQMKIVELYYIF